MNASEFLNSIRAKAQLAVGEKPSCPPGYCAGLDTCGDYRCPNHPGTPTPPRPKDVSKMEIAVWGFTALCMWTYVLVKLFGG